MALTPEKRTQMLSATREAAAAFVEDLAHMREVLKRVDPIKDELRRLSNVLRRFLIDCDGDVRRIAPPRTGRLTINAPDNNSFYRAEKLGPYPFFGSGGCKAFGVWQRGAIVDRGSRSRPIELFDPEATVELSQDGFLGQKVLCLEGEWVTRRDVISFVANTASGVHSGKASTKAEYTLAVIRNAVHYGLAPVPNHPGEMAALISFNFDAIGNLNSEFTYAPGHIDSVLFELLCAAFYFVGSQRVVELERFILSELNVLASERIL